MKRKLFCIPALSMLIQFPTFWILFSLVLVVTAFLLWRLKKSLKVNVIIILIVVAVFMIPGVLVTYRVGPDTSNGIILEDGSLGPPAVSNSSNATSTNFLFEPMFYKGCGS